MEAVIIFLIVVPVVVIIVRMLGAWMLRINEVISIQREILEELRKSNSRRF